MEKRAFLRFNSKTMVGLVQSPWFAVVGLKRNLSLLQICVLCFPQDLGKQMVEVAYRVPGKGSDSFEVHQPKNSDADSFPAMEIHWASEALGAPVILLPFLGEGSPIKIDHRKAKRVPTYSNLSTGGPSMPFFPKSTSPKKSDADPFFPKDISTGHLRSEGK